MAGDANRCQWCQAPVHYHWAGTDGNRNRWHRLNPDGSAHYCGQTDAATVARPAPRPAPSPLKRPSRWVNVWLAVAALVVVAIILFVGEAVWDNLTPPPTARCVDGSLSYSQHRSGTCSYHGGVAQWLPASRTIP